ncbi:MAG: hypothetical protein KAT43_00715 [Nanoarchaeota archaeon]|nr:hypothetical protein [Nanoarchaeota archaeon]
MDATVKMMNTKSSVSVPDKILQMIRIRGYVLPADITRELRINSLFAGAHLSEMADAGKLKISNTKVGSSPAYYLPETVSSLERLEKYLNEKDKKTFQILKEKKILREKDYGPLIQVSLRNLKDFAVPLRVNKEEIFWKYFLVPDEEATLLIKQLIDSEKEQAMEREAPKVTPPKPIVPGPKIKEKPKPKVLPKKKIVPEKPKIIKKEKKIEPKEEKEKEIQTKIMDEGEKQPELTVKSEFYDQIVAYCDKKKIKILEAEIIKKGDIELILEVPTVIGNVKYFAKARSKKRNNDGDLSSAYVRGQTKSLPTLFITTGKVTKKALEMLGKDFKQMIVKEIE